jgi:mycothiol synthase
MELPEGYTTRVPTQGDAEVVAALIWACQIADTGASDMSVEEMLDDWHSLDLSEEAVILSAPDGRIAAYADVFNRSFVIVSVYGYVHPDYRGMGLGSYLVAWGERWTRDHMPQAQANARVVVQHYINSANEPARRLLENLGYSPVRGIYVMETTLDDPPPLPRWPADISVRTFVPGRDERAVYEAIEDAFRDLWGRPRNPFERFLRETKKESFDPSLWFSGLGRRRDRRTHPVQDARRRGMGRRSGSKAPVAEPRVGASPPSSRLHRVPQAWYP